MHGNYIWLILFSSVSMTMGYLVPKPKYCENIFMDSTTYKIVRHFFIKFIACNCTLKMNFYIFTVIECSLFVPIWEANILENLTISGYIENKGSRGETASNLRVLIF